VKGLTCLASAVAVVAVTGGCGSSEAASTRAAASLPTNVTLVASTKSTGGKAVVLTGTLSPGVSQKGHLYSMQVKGFEVGSGASFDDPSYVNQDNCVGGSTCSWTVLPSKAGKYEYEVILSDLVHDNTVGEANAVKVKWTAPPRPKAIRLFVNGKTPPHVPLTGDHYSKFPAGPMTVVAKWKTNARHTGYYVLISDDYGTKVKCSTGTSCRVPKKVPLKAGSEDSWVMELVTTKGNKVATGFKACVNGVAKS
jgi:hypothetical protein